jgi:hypothetical protein
MMHLYSDEPYVQPVSVTRARVVAHTHSSARRPLHAHTSSVVGDCDAMRLGIGDSLTHTLSDPPVPT